MALAGDLVPHTARFYLDLAPWYAEEGDLKLLPALADAVWGERRLRFVYDSWKARVTREADAIGLVRKSGAWYLVASVEDQPRAYRVSNIIDAALIEGPAIAARQLLQLGTEIEVLGPKPLRQAIQREAAAVAALYRKRR